MNRSRRRPPPFNDFRRYLVGRWVVAGRFNFVMIFIAGFYLLVAEFDLPADAMPSDLPRECYGEEHPPRNSVEMGSGRTFHAWRLRFEADVPGADFERTYRVSVEAAVDAKNAPA